VGKFELNKKNKKGDARVPKEVVKTVSDPGERFIEFLPR
jgi:hypothetical protein